tara:strand:+ start:1140 stop:1313 length:174 start_codon:yes stop_codon:yes gene_type:complete
MNTWPGPENSWEGVDAYFTWADSPGMLVLFTLVAAAICLLVIISAARHESDTANKNE